MTRGSWLLPPAQAFSQRQLLGRLLGTGWRFLETPLSLRLWYWLAPLLTAVLGGILRFVRLGDPPSLVFDETYYVKDAYSYLISGYERAWNRDPNPGFNQGDYSSLLDAPGFVVHPPVGKWIIAWGMQLFGTSSTFGWRFGTALVGTLAILLLALIAQKMFRSTLLGTLAGLLLAVDGHAIVMSRTAILDNFVMFFALLGFGALLMDRDDGRRRLARRLAQALDGERVGSDSTRLLYGPWLGIRWWRIAAGVSLGLCAGSKWTGVFFLAAFAVMSVLWDASARRIAGIRYWFMGAVLKDSPLAFISLVLVSLGTYLASWTGWFLSSNAYDRNWAQSNPSSTWDWIPASLRSLWAYHQSMYSAGLAIESDHPYKANAWSWFVMGRPTSFFAEYPGSGCNGDKCAQVVNSVGNPLIWWAGAAALTFLLGYWLLRRDWRAGAILCGWAAGYLPWLMYPNRTIFFFYAIAYEPYLILAVVFCLGLILGTRDDPPWRRQQGAMVVGVFVVLVLLISAFFLPIWTAQTITYDDWRSHMWMPSWI
ncbi:dolichyl-phosphate-mannose--protein mannosyltransferase [Psychromicrobium xiongbiense]|uniref:dolichyl-phosphate-mannose--protein mannosyltransferase n=1 Tax=Psychromicrobium xiongbiense TaxID=3051184 RepID=UPI0025563B10|nr:phospholipid carrier-dependent glycosyltransferase [Psychromicrobium sp. YIM S02556]